MSRRNRARSWELSRDYHYVSPEGLAQQAAQRRTKSRIRARILLLGATTVPLCLSLFDRARYKTAKGAVKMHTLLDHDGHLPHIKSFIGTGRNAVMVQIWTALITIPVLKAPKQMAKYKWHLSNPVAAIRPNMFVKIDLAEVVVPATGSDMAKGSP